jgi:hypothetical protein
VGEVPTVSRETLAVLALLGMGAGYLALALSGHAITSK